MVGDNIRIKEFELFQSRERRGRLSAAVHGERQSKQQRPMTHVRHDRLADLERTACRGTTMNAETASTKSR